MNKSVNIALVGCGFMGVRHLHGFKELRSRNLKSTNLTAVCDLKIERANEVANIAKIQLGHRPAVYSDVQKMLKQEKELDSIDLVVDPAFHHTIADLAFQAGKHVLVEKPMGITVNTCRKMVNSAKKHGRTLGVAENYRRDPLNRLVKMVLDAETIGSPFMILQHLVEGGGKIAVSPWRHLKNRGGILLDMGVHYTDLLRYFFGEVNYVYGKLNMFEDVRKGIEVTGWPIEVRARMENKSAEVNPTAEDTALAIFEFKNGVVGQWITSLAGYGKNLWQRIIFGSKGRLDAPLDRSGNPLAITLKGGKKLSEQDILNSVTTFPQEEVTHKIFPGGLYQYKLPFQEADRRLIAIELHDFTEAIIKGNEPEVNGVDGLKAVAFTYAIFESAFACQPVKVSDIESGKISSYQRDIDKACKTD